MKNILRLSLLLLLSLQILDAASLKLRSNIYNTEEKIKTVRLYDNNWVSISDFLKKFGSQTQLNKEEWILISTVESKKLTFFGGSMFYKVDMGLYHFPTTVERVGNEFFIPEGEFLKFLQAHLYKEMFFKELQNEYILAPSPYTLTDIDVKEFKNGSMVRIETSKKFNKKHCSLWEGTNGWLYFTVYGGNCDTTQLERHFDRGVIRSITPIQLDNSVQFSFKLRHGITGFEFYIEERPSSIVINLRKPLKDDVKQQLLESRSKWLIDTIVLDAGHGGKDPGTHGYDGTREKDITLDIVKRLGNLLEKNLDVKVVYTRKTDKFIPLKDRTSIANRAGGKLFISVHCNGTRNKSVSGTETYLLSLSRNSEAIEVAELENKAIQFEDNQEFYAKLTSEQRIIASLAQNTYMNESVEFARVIEENYVKSLHNRSKKKSRGVKQAGFYVLVGASMPNILTEVGFLTNRTDLKNLKKSTYRQKIAQSLYYAIKEFKNTYEKEIRSR